MWRNACDVVDLAVEDEKTSFIEMVRTQTKKNKEIEESKKLSENKLYFNNAIQCIEKSMLKSHDNKQIVLLVDSMMTIANTLNCKFDYEKLNADDVAKHFSSLGFDTYINRYSLRQTVKSSVTIYW